MVKKDTIKYNNERVEKAEDENEIWKIVNDITNPKCDKKWILEEQGVTIEDDQEVAEVFNDFFITKIRDLKANIDQNKIEDPIITYLLTTYLLTYLL